MSRFMDNFKANYEEAKASLTSQKYDRHGYRTPPQDSKDENMALVGTTLAFVPLVTAGVSIALLPLPALVAAVAYVFGASSALVGTMGYGGPEMETLGRSTVSAAIAGYKTTFNAIAGKGTGADTGHEHQMEQKSQSPARPKPPGRPRMP